MKKINAFTLAEAVAVLVLLGVVFAITIPSAINNANIKSRQLKLKKAVADYQKIVENIVVENDIPRDELSFKNQVSCLLIRQYYKSVQTLDAEDKGCKFLSVNEIYWDFTDVTAPIVAFNPDYFTSEKALSDENTAFKMHAAFSDGGIRVNDLGYEKEHGTDADYKNVSKIDCFMNNKTCKRSDFKKGK